MKFDENSILKISAVGDICPGDKAIMGVGILNKTLEKGVNYPFLKLPSVFRGSDIVFGNLEGLLTHEVKFEKRDQLTFCGLPEFAQSLSNMGFNVLNVSNNHTLEHGASIFLETIEHLKKVDIQICGLRNNQENDYFSKPVIIKKKGKITGIIAYNWICQTNRLKDADKYIAQSHDSIVNYTYNRELKRNELNEGNRNVIEDIKKLRENVDILILSAHWGYEFVNLPPFGVTQEAKMFIDSGADIIIGTHPHVIQGVEIYKNKPIFYSLGNFLFDGRINKSQTRKSVILNITINDNNKIDYSFLPIIRTKELQICLADIKEKREINNIVKRSSIQISSDKKDINLNDNVIYKKYVKMYRKNKIVAIIKHFLAIFENSRVIKIIYIKSLNNLKKTINNFKEQKTRW